MGVGIFLLSAQRPTGSKEAMDDVQVCIQFLERLVQLHEQHFNKRRKPHQQFAVILGNLASAYNWKIKNLLLQHGTQPGPNTTVGAEIVCLYKLSCAANTRSQQLYADCELTDAYSADTRDVEAATAGIGFGKEACSTDVQMLACLML